MTPETGGITILVSLLLLVLLTISALAMSKNALREVIISGTSRQAADVRNLADSGLEWSIFWMAEDLSGTRPAPAADSGAEALRALTQQVAVDSTLQGQPQTLVTTGTDMEGMSTPNATRSFDLQITNMGQLEIRGTQKNVQQTLDAYNPATLQLWSVRSNARLEYPGDQVFIHSREAWFTLLPKQP